MCHCQSVDLSVIRPICEKNAGKPGALITILQEVQAAIGWLPEAAMEAIARETGIPASRIYGVATFYSQFRLEPKGRHTVRVCQGTACHVAGAAAVVADVCDHLGIEPGQTSADGLFTVEPVACLGCCSLAVAVMVDETTHARMDACKTLAVLDGIRKEDGQ